MRGPRTLLLSLARVFFGSHEETRPDHADPRLRTRVLDRAPDEVWDRAMELADGELEGWSVIEADRDNGRIRAESRTRYLDFVDDIEIRIDRVDAGTRVDLDSASRIGMTDLGENARRIIRFYDALTAGR